MTQASADLAGRRSFFSYRCPVNAHANSRFQSMTMLAQGASPRGPAHIAFVGLPGSGKSTIGRQLARRLDRPFLDSDQVIEKRIGSSIREFFEREGEDAFRDLEQAILDELTLGYACVLSTGGGAVLRPENRRHLKERTHAVYLHSAPEEIFRRLRHDQNRPLLQVADPLARLRELYLLRDPLYRESSRFLVETGRPSVATLVHTIVAQLESIGAVIREDT